MDDSYEQVRDRSNKRKIIVIGSILGIIGVVIVSIFLIVGLSSNHNNNVDQGKNIKPTNEEIQNVVDGNEKIPITDKQDSDKQTTHIKTIPSDKPVNQNTNDKSKQPGKQDQPAAPAASTNTTEKQSTTTGNKNDGKEIKNPTKTILKNDTDKDKPTSGTKNTSDTVKKDTTIPMGPPAPSTNKGTNDTTHPTPATDKSSQIPPKSKPDVHKSPNNTVPQGKPTTETTPKKSTVRDVNPEKFQTNPNVEEPSKKQSDNVPNPKIITEETTGIKTRKHERDRLNGRDKYANRGNKPNDEVPTRPPVIVIGGPTDQQIGDKPPTSEPLKDQTQKEQIVNDNGTENTTNRVNGNTTTGNQATQGTTTGTTTTEIKITVGDEKLDKKDKGEVTGKKKEQIRKVPAPSEKDVKQTQEVQPPQQSQISQQGNIVEQSQNEQKPKEPIVEASTDKSSQIPSKPKPDVTQQGTDTNKSTESVRTIKPETSKQHAGLGTEGTGISGNSSTKETVTNLGDEKSTTTTGNQTTEGEQITEMNQSEENVIYNRKTKYRKFSDQGKYEPNLDRVFNPSKDETDPDYETRWMMDYKSIYDIEKDNFIFSKTYGNSAKPEQIQPFESIDFIYPNYNSNLITQVNFTSTSKYYHPLKKTNKFCKVLYKGFQLVEDILYRNYISILVEDIHDNEIISLIGTQPDYIRTGIQFIINNKNKKTARINNNYINFITAIMRLKLTGKTDFNP